LRNQLARLRQSCAEEYQRDDSDAEGTGYPGGVGVGHADADSAVGSFTHNCVAGNGCSCRRAVGSHRHCHPVTDSQWQAFSARCDRKDDVLGCYSPATAGPTLSVAPNSNGVLVANTQVEAGETVGFKAAGFGAIPTGGVNAVMVAVTAETVTPGAGYDFGYATMWPVGSPAPLVASSVWTNGEKPTNVITVPLSADGRINLFSGFQAIYTVRVVGWFATPTLAGSTFTYDNNGNRVTETDTATGVVSNYTWDPLDRLTSVSRGIPGAPANIISETPTITGNLYHAWWGAAVTTASPGVNVPATVERNTFTGLNVTPGSYELEFTGTAASAVNVTPYLVFHQNWTNYVEPVERVTSPQGQLAAKPWTGTRKWAVTVPAAQTVPP
jgi:YD repeat-containing protein